MIVVTTVDSIVKGLVKSVAKLEKLAAQETDKVSSLEAGMDKMAREAADHRKEVARALRVAENLKKLVA